jgi:translocation and assembly module TamA
MPASGAWLMLQGLFKLKFFISILMLITLPCLLASEADPLGSKITIKGVSSDIQTNIALHLGLEDNLLPLSNLGFPRSNEYILSKTEQALQAMGYYQPSIELSAEHNAWLIDITLNKAIRWQQIEVVLDGEGKNSPALLKLISEQPLSSGSVLNHGEYRNFKSHLQNHAMELGFLGAQFEMSQLIVDINESTANVKWIFNTGDPYLINSVVLQGSELSQDFLSRYLHFSSEQIYQQGNIIKSQQALNRSGYFNLVNIEQKIDHDKKVLE